MKEHHAREFIFETKIKKLLEDSRYITVVDENVYGRSGSHEIFSYVKVNMPTAFVFPVRMICKYKYYAKNKVELAHIRDFGGIMADITECNYAMKSYSTNNSGTNIADRYTDAGCYFSVTEFSRAAQEYAWAHNIFLMAFEKIELIQPMLKSIEDYVSNINENTITNISRKELLQGFEDYCKRNSISDDCIQGVVAILNDTYPVLILGLNNWLDSIIIESQQSETGRVFVEKTTRISNQFGTKLDIIVKDSNLEFYVPSVIVEKLMERKDNFTADNIMFKVDIPYLTQKGKRGFATMELFVEGFSKSEYGYEQISFF